MINEKQIKESSNGLSALQKLETSNQSPVPASLPLVTAVENLIEVVGESQTHLFASLTERDYQELVRILDNLIDVVGEDENHILATVMDFIGVLIENYEDKHVPELMEIQV
jgi:HTH-type transcriptional regulator/antitoxin HigA